MTDYWKPARFAPYDKFVQVTDGNYVFAAVRLREKEWVTYSPICGTIRLIDDDLPTHWLPLATCPEPIRTAAHVRRNRVPHTEDKPR